MTNFLQHQNNDESLISTSVESFIDEETIVKNLLPEVHFNFRLKELIQSRALNLISKVRNSNQRGIEHFLKKFSIDSEQGSVIISLAEALIRIPDDHTARELIIDKFSNRKWSSSLLNYQSLDLYLITCGLYIASCFANLHRSNNYLAKTITTISNPVLVTAIKYIIKSLSHQFILADNIHEGVEQSKKYSQNKYRFSFDLLGESARSTGQADQYYDQYLKAIAHIKSHFSGTNIEEIPSLSIKLSSLNARFEYAKAAQLEQILLPKLVKLVTLADQANIAITFDAEESWRSDIYLHIITKLIMSPELGHYNMLGFVVQAYQKKAYSTINYIVKLAAKHNKQFAIRLVKGAYWDSEIKHAQEKGLIDYPVFTKKSYTDLNYIACAKNIFENSAHIRPQFATHNANTVATIIELSNGRDFELQKLHGMGNALYNILVKTRNVRIYAPIGSLSDLLPYLLRRILENGASSSFISQIATPTITSESLVEDLYDKINKTLTTQISFTKPLSIYPQRDNSMGYDLGNKADFEMINDQVNNYFSKQYTVSSIINGKELFIAKHSQEIFRPAKPAEKIGEICYATENEIKDAINIASSNASNWSITQLSKRTDILRQIALAFEVNKFELYSLLLREAGKTISDAINEVREAIDFCRYYANMAEVIMLEKTLPSPTGELDLLSMHGRGVFLCISPWNFPLAIFTGQIVAALVTGNSVIAKPANQTSIIAAVVVRLMHRAGVPAGVLNLVLCSGSQISQYIVHNERINGVAFTGSNNTARIINKILAERQGYIPSFIAETGGQNAMIVDSSALLEQVTDDVVASAFYSAGQRCSALRVLYVQEEIFEPLSELISGAIDNLNLGDTIDFATDIGPIIDKTAFDNLNDHITVMSKNFKIIASHAQKSQIADGYFFYPHVIEINNINDIDNEKFGPILHIIKYNIKDLDKIIDEINGCGFGLTFGIHSRIEDRIKYIRSRIKVGNIYINRTMTGAQVESHPFGGEGKSGTGFKAGGPHYLLKFMTERTTSINLTAIGGNVELLKST